MGRKTLLTPEVQAKVVAYIRQGAYEWVAAQAAGIGRRTFYHWMESGEKYPNSPYRQFWHEVTQAHAEARVLAETEVRKTNPVAWLRYGPGREKKDQPGWTESHEITLKRGDLVKMAMSEGLSEEEAAQVVDMVLKAGDG